MVLLIGITTYGQLRPENNWDMVAYVAISRASQADDITQLHRDVYAELEQSVSTADFEALTASGDVLTSSEPFLVATASDARAFAQQLPFYLVKPAYPLLIAGLATTGLNPFAASVLIASAAYAGFGLLAWSWLRRHHPPIIGTLLTALLVISPPFMILARLSTPDSLSLLVILASAYAIVSRRAGLALGLCLLAVLIRPNNAAWAVLLALYLATAAPPAVRPRRWVPLLTIALVGVLYVGITRWAGYYPLPTLFHHAIVEYLPYPAEFVPTWGLREYARQYVHEFLAFQYGGALFFLFVGGVVLLGLRSAHGSAHDPLTGLVALAVLASAAQWAVYPIEPERILAGQLAIIAIALAIIVGRPTQVPGFGSSYVTSV